MTAKLTFYYGTMACGKSTYCLQMNHNLKSKNFLPYLLKSAIDVRDEGVIRSRIGIEHGVNYFNYDNTIDLYALKCTHILVDEAQFLNKDQIDLLIELVDGYNIDVVCFGLRTDFTGKLFDGTAMLFAMADDLIELPVLNEDNRKCICHLRSVNGEPVFSGKSIQVGGDEMYESVSRKQWNKIRNLK